MSQITDALLKRIAPTISPALRKEYLKWLNEFCLKYEIVNELRLSAYFANCMEESGRLSRTVENLNYSATRLMAVWPSRFPSLSVAKQYANNPQKLANYVYNGRNGNRKNTDDGWTFRGRGLNQTTGRGNYEIISDTIGVDFVSDPHKLEIPRYAVESSCAEFKRRGCNRLADSRQITSIRRAINGGTNGLANVKIFYSSCLSWIPDDFQLSKEIVKLTGDSEPVENPEVEDNSAPIEDISPEVDDSTNEQDQGSPSFVDPEDQKLPDGSSEDSQKEGQEKKEVLCKERPSTFTKWMTGIKVGIGTAITGITGYCGSSEAIKTISQQGAERAVQNVDQPIVEKLIVILVSMVAVMGVGVFLIWIGSKFYDRSAERSNRLNLAKLSGAQDKDKTTSEFVS